MKTFLAQNQFLSAASLRPEAASSPLSSLSEAAVTPIQSSCDRSEVGRAETGNMSRSIREEDLVSDPLPGSRGTAVRGAAIQPCAGVTPGSQEATGPSVPPGPKLPAGATVSAGLSDDDLYWQLRFADDPFTRDLTEIPDPHAFFNSIIEIDIWADDVPLFLKGAA